MSLLKSSTLSSLLRQTSLDDHERVLEETEDVLSRSQNDLEAQHIKLVALLKLDRFHDASHAVDIGGDALKIEAPLAVAYALYKAGRMTEARTAAVDFSQHSRGLKHVEAQTSYRLENFSSAAQLYGQLAQQGLAENNETIDVRVNTTATQSQIIWTGEQPQHGTVKSSNSDLQQFETAFNAACASIARGQIKQADFYLQRAAELCAGTDELSEEEKALELLPIKAQQLYVQILLGETEEAASLAEDLDTSRTTDASTRHIAQVNGVMAKAQPLNPFLYDRMIQQQGETTTTDALFKFQDFVLQQNRDVLKLLMGKASAVVKGTTSKTMNSGKAYAAPDTITTSVIHAAFCSQGKLGKPALTEVLRLQELRPNDVGLLLTAVQLACSINDVETATKLTESFLTKYQSKASSEDHDLRFSPALVALLVALYMKSSRLAQAKAELLRASSHWRQQVSKNNAESASVLKAAATALLQESSPEELHTSHELFRFLDELDASAATSAGRAASLQSFGELEHRREGRLPEVRTLTDNIDGAALEKAGVPRLEVADANMRPQKRAAPDATQRTQSAKKPRKAKLSKPVDPSVQPDPERWLPARDRSNYKPKGKRKGKPTGGMATQGGISEDSRPSTPVVSQVLQQTKNKKKKKSGR